MRLFSCSGHPWLDKSAGHMQYSVFTRGREVASAAFAQMLVKACVRLACLSLWQWRHLHCRGARKLRQKSHILMVDELPVSSVHLCHCEGYKGFQEWDATIQRSYKGYKGLQELDTVDTKSLKKRGILKGDVCTSRTLRTA